MLEDGYVLRLNVYLLNRTILHYAQECDKRERPHLKGWVTKNCVLFTTKQLKPLINDLSFQLCANAKEDELINK